MLYQEFLIQNYQVRFAIRNSYKDSKIYLILSKISNNEEIKEQKFLIKMKDQFEYVGRDFKVISIQKTGKSKFQGLLYNKNKDFSSFAMKINKVKNTGIIKIVRNNTANYN